MTTRRSRPRRLRATAAMRDLVRETRLHPAQLVWPVFIKEGIDQPQPIESMPGVMHWPLSAVADLMAQAAEVGIGAVMLFGVPEQRDALGTGAVDPGGILNRAIGAAAGAARDQVLVMADLCLDEFTDHGHCGVLDERGAVDNDATVEIYARMAVAQAQAGVNAVGLSGMMDHQVGAVRDALEDAGHHEVSILAYSAKYTSTWYGPFRDAVESRLDGDRTTYQMDPANAVEAVREALDDVEQGADIVMVKPALAYLDIVRDVAQAVDVPVAAYHVSGEYSQIEAAAQRGWIDRMGAHREVWTALVRAGASVVLTYAAIDLAREWRP